MSLRDPYDEVPYESTIVEWAAPERMAVTARLHGGPAPPVSRYRYLELGCGDAANLLPLARYRPEAQFVGVDGSAALMALARAGQAAIGAPNLRLVHGTFDEALPTLDGTFDYVVLHGVFSWIDDETRDALLAFAERALAPNGLLYVSYNALPGWNVRGMVRDYLQAQTRNVEGLRARAEGARQVAARFAELLERSGHPYSRLMAGEFAFVRDAKDSYVAHEYLAPINRAYWQSEFHALLREHALSFVADADFAYPSARLPEGLAAWIEAEGLEGRAACDTVDMLCFAQFRCALACRADAPRAPWQASGLRDMRIASRMVARDPGADGLLPSLKTTSGFEVTFRDEGMKRALHALAAAGETRPVGALFDSLEDVAGDLVLLHRHGAVELRLWEPSLPVCPVLRARERAARGEHTSPQHLRIAAPQEA